MNSPDRPEATISADVCVVGAGPAGSTLALALARLGRKVVVLEQSKHFDRSFRGESISPDSVLVLDRLGVLDALRAQDVLTVRRMEVRDAGMSVLRVDFDRFTGEHRYPMEIPQPMLLGALTDASRELTNYTLVRGAKVVGLREAEGRVTGVDYVLDGETRSVSAAATIAADGRYSKVRDMTGLPYVKNGLDRDFLWFKVSAPESWDLACYQVRIDGAMHAMCIPTFGDFIRIGFNIPPSGLRDLRKQGIGALHETVARLIPELADVVREQITSWSDTSALEIFTTVAPSWHKPGVLLIGDAAHTLSPVLAQGVNHAILDGILLSQLLDEALETGTDAAVDAAFAELQKLREPSVAKARSIQLRQEKVFTLDGMTKTRLRRTGYRVLNSLDRVKTKVWSQVYYTLDNPGEPVRRALPTAAPAAQL